MQPLIDGLQQCQDSAGCLEGNYDVAFAQDNPQCPKPLVVPDRDDPTTPIPGSGCALPCLSFMYTDDEWDIFLETFNFFSYFGLAAGLYMTGVGIYNLIKAGEKA